MSQNGWIKLHRKIMQDWVAQDAEYFRAWCIILMEVNHADNNFLIGSQLYNCKRGESYNSLGTWARRFNWSKSKVRRFFNLLKKDQKIDTMTVGKTTRLTVCNYMTYQDERHDGDTITDTLATRWRHDGDTQTRMNKNDKNVKKERKREGFRPPSLDEVKNYVSQKSKENSKYKQFDAETFYLQKESNGWKNGQVKMKSWERTVDLYVRKEYCFRKEGVRERVARQMGVDLD